VLALLDAWWVRPAAREAQKPTGAHSTPVVSARCTPQRAMLEVGVVVPG